MRPKETWTTGTGPQDGPAAGAEAAPAVDASLRIGEHPMIEQQARARFSSDAIGRRGVLLGLAAVAGSAALGLGPTRAGAQLLAGPGEGDGDADGSGGTAAGTVFASFITDVHIDAAATAQDVHLQLVLSDARALGATLVLHGGDITEFGSNEIYDRYLRLVPEDYPAAIEHVAGNHETRWDPTAGGLYRARLHPEGSRSFDHQQVHVIMLEVARPLQEEAHVDAATLEWLRADLRAAGRTPSIIVMHCPPGADFRYVNGAEDLFALIAEHPVKAILAGHNHSETLTWVNGTLVLTGRAVKRSPVHYVLRHSPTDENDQLTIDAVAIPAPGDDGERTVTHLATIPLDASTAQDRDALPREASARVIGETVRIRAEVGAEDALVQARAQLADLSAYGTTQEGTWYDMAASGTGLARDLDLAAIGADLLPGRHRARIRGTDADGVLWEASAPFTHRGGAVRALETFAVEGAVSGALALTREGSVLVPTDRGEVISLVLRGSRLQQQWRVTTGPVHRGIAVDGDSGLALVPSTEHALVAIDTRHGREAWRTSFDHRVTSTPATALVDGERTTLVAAGPELHRLDAQGGILWSVPLPVQSCGRPLVIGDAVVIGAGDGTARAYSLAMGAERWSAVLADRATAYQRLLYGPWTTSVRPLGEDAVLVGTVGSLHALSAADGSALWSAPVAAMYTPPVILEDGSVLVVQERGQTALIDPAAGSATPIGEGGQVSLDAGIATVPGVHRAWHVSYTGVLSLIDAEAGTVAPQRQVTTSRVISTPVYLSDAAVLVVGDQDGTVHALDVSRA